MKKMIIIILVLLLAAGTLFADEIIRNNGKVAVSSFHRAGNLVYMASNLNTGVGVAIIFYNHEYEPISGTREEVVDQMMIVVDTLGLEAFIALYGTPIDDWERTVDTEDDFVLIEYKK